MDQPLHIKMDVAVRDHLHDLRGIRLPVFLVVALNEADLHAGRGEPLAARDIARQTGLAERTISRTLDELQDGQWIVKLPHRSARGEKLYRVNRYVWSGEVPERAPAAAHLPDEAADLPGQAGELPAAAGDPPADGSSAVVVVNKRSCLDLKQKQEQQQQQNTQECQRESYEIFRAANIRGKMLGQLAAKVAPELAREWVDWLAHAPASFTNPSGYLIMHLLADPTEKPPAAATRETPRTGTQAAPRARWYDPEEAWIVHGTPEHTQYCIEHPGVFECNCDKDLSEEPEVAAPDAGGAPTAQDIWQEVVENLKLSMARAPFEAWVRPTVALGWDGDMLVVCVHNPYAKEWLESRLQPVVQRAVKHVLGKPVQVRYVTKDEG